MKRENPQKILVIGGGPAGLITLHNLRTYGNFSHVQLYERRKDIGGVWYLDNPLEPTPSPATAEPLSSGNISSTQWPSPAYPGLIGNVLPQPFLSFNHFPFPSFAESRPHQPFPTLDETYDYLHAFAKPYFGGNGIKLNMEVVRVEERSDGAWHVLTRSWNEAGKDEETVWDSVVIANGWYDHPVWPNTPGLDVLKDKGLAVHAKWYRGPQFSKDKSVLVIGNANSSNDIAAHLITTAKLPIYQSIRRPNFPGFPALPDDRISLVAPVLSYVLHSTPNTISAHLNDGTVINDIDLVYVGTGYKPYPDFIYVFEPPQVSDSGSASNLDVDSRLENGYLIRARKEEEERKLQRLVDQNPQPDVGHRIPSLHKHIVYAYNTTLAFIGAPMSFTPFIINDVSSLWLTYFLSSSSSASPASLDSSSSISHSSSTSTSTLPTFSVNLNTPPSILLQYEKHKIETIQKWRKNIPNPSALYAFGVLGMEEEDYAQGLKEDIIKIKPDWKMSLPEWNEELRKKREKMYIIKTEAMEWDRGHGGVGR